MTDIDARKLQKLIQKRRRALGLTPSRLRPYASRIIEKLKADGARVCILDETV
jgi:phosphoserine phosphatase